MKFEEMEKALRERRDLKALIDSPEGKALAAGLDEAALKKAAGFFYGGVDNIAVVIARRDDGR